MGEHLRFEMYGTSGSGKTYRWEVRSTHGSGLLALIGWHGPWRRYVVYPQGGTLFDAACLAEIAAFLSEQMEARKR